MLTSKPLLFVLLSLALAAAVPACATDPVSPVSEEAFDYPDGALNGTGGWTGSATSAAISIENGEVKISGGPATSVDVRKALNPRYQPDILWVHARVKAGSGTTTLWSLTIDDAAGENYGRWYGSGTTARGRIDGSGTLVTPAFTLQPGWNDIDFKTTFSNKTTEFFLNDALVGTFSYWFDDEWGGNKPAGGIAQVRLERMATNSVGQFALLDDIRIGTVPYGDGALEFDGIDDFVRVPHTPSLAFSGAITVETWVYIRSHTPEAGLISKGDIGESHTNREYSLNLHDSLPSFHWWTGGSAAGFGDTLPLNTWIHVAASCDQANIRVYVNGDLRVQGETSSLPPDLGMPLHFGVSTAFLQYFHGKLDEVRVWNTARTNQEIRSTMHQALTGSEQGLAGCWNFNEGSGTTVYDLSPNANHGILGGDAAGSDLPLRVSADPDAITVPSSWTPEGWWVDTGIDLTEGEIIQVTASGLWSTSTAGGFYGADGTAFQSSDQFLNPYGEVPGAFTSHYGSLIGYIGGAPPAIGSYFYMAGALERQASAGRMIVLGSDDTAMIPVSGRLWLGMNSDAYSGRDSDNAGSLNVSVEKAKAYNPKTGNFYSAIAVPEGVTWTQARQIAIMEGGHLVTISSAAENDFVFDLVNDSDTFWQISGDFNVGPFIGAQQAPGSPEPTGGWQWTTGDPMVYSNWAPGRPDNWDGIEHVAHMVGIGDAKGNLWNDVSDGEPHTSYVIEFEHRKALNAANNHYYEVVAVPERITWADARDAANAAGGYLATIASAEENEFVFNLAKDVDAAWYNIPAYGWALGPWLGGYQPDGSPEPVGGWRWTTGEPWSFNNWASGQPGDADGLENCLQYAGLDLVRSSTWNDVYGDTPMWGYVVEYEPVFVDDFNDNARNEDIWIEWIQGTGPNVHETNQRLECNFPASSSGDRLFTGYYTRPVFRGDFDIQVDFECINWPATNGVRTGIGLMTPAWQGFLSHQRTSLGAAETSGPHEIYVTHNAWGHIEGAPTSDLQGRLRLVRSGSIVSSYYWQSGEWVNLYYGQVYTGDVHIQLLIWSDTGSFCHQDVTFAYDNFIVNKGSMVSPINGAAYNPANGHYYQAVSDLVGASWHYAETTAEATVFLGRRGHLATITSPAEQQFINERFPGSALYWIGGYQPLGSSEPGAAWRWVTGEKWEYANWSPGQPDNHFEAPGPEDWLELTGNGMWNDGSAVPAPGYIVEYEYWEPGPLLNPANGHYYQSVPAPEALTWHEAKAAAEGMEFAGVKGHLVAIANAEENIFILRNFPAIQQYWLGGFQPSGSSEPDGGWQWVTGEPWSYANWYFNEPSNSGGNEDGLTIYATNGGWNDLDRMTKDDGKAVGFVVEFEPAKCLPDGRTTSYNGVATAVFGSVFYLEQEDRSSGIRAEAPLHGLTPGIRASATGTIRTNVRGERYIEAASVAPGIEAGVNPVALANRFIGGGDYWYNPAAGLGQRGITGACGLNNIGLLVRTMGCVTASGEDPRAGICWFYLDDGSNVSDGTGVTGVYVESAFGAIDLPPAGSYLSVTAISSCEIYLGNLVSVLLPRSEDDIVVLRGSQSYAMWEPESRRPRDD